MGLGDQLLVLLVRGDFQGRRVNDVGTATLQRGDQIAGPAVGGHADPEALELIKRQAGDWLSNRIARSGPWIFRRAGITHRTDQSIEFAPLQVRELATRTGPMAFPQHRR